MAYVTAGKVESPSETMENAGVSIETSNTLIGVKQYAAVVYKDSAILDAIRKREKLIEILRNVEYDQCFVFVNYISM